MIIDFSMDEEAWAGLPGAQGLAQAAVHAALEHLTMDAEGASLSLTLADDATVEDLNRQWRGKPKPTNVLSFPADQTMALPPGEARPMGDIILAAGVVRAEAEEQNKPLNHHFIHLVVHGFLHLLGHDHMEEGEAEQMETLEKDILAKLDIPNPYWQE